MNCRLPITIILAFTGFFWRENIGASDWRSLCEKTDHLASLTGQIRNIPWPGFISTPAGPVATIAWVTRMEENPLLSYCSIMRDVTILNGEQLVRKYKDNIVELTEEKSRERIDFMFDSLDMARYIEKRLSQKGTNFTENDLRRLDQFIGTATQFHNNNVTHENKIWDTTTRHAREMEMQRIAKAAGNIKSIDEKLKCDNSEEVHEIPREAREAHSKNQNELRELEREYFSLDRYLKDISIRFLELDQYQDFMQDYLNIVHKYFPIEQEIKSVVIPYQDKKGVKKKTSQEYFKYTAKGPFANIVDRFKETYNPKWKSWVLRQGGYKNAITKDRRLREDMKYSYVSYDCSEYIFYKKYDSEDPDIRYKVREDVKNCIQENLKSHQKVENSFIQFVDLLTQNIENMAKLNAEIYTYKSRYFEQHTFLTDTDVKYTGLKTQSVECISAIPVSGLRQIIIELKKQRADLSLMIAEQLTIRDQKDAQKEEDAQYKLEQEKVNRAIYENLKNRTETTDRPMYHSGTPVL